MFKFLANKNDDPGFPNAVILVNKSEHWLELHDIGKRIPPKTRVAIESSLVAKSSELANFVSSGFLVTSGAPQVQESRPKRRKKVDEPAVEKSKDEVLSADEQLPPEPTDIQQELKESTILVSPLEPDNWVSSTENIVGEPTPDQI